MRIAIPIFKVPKHVSSDIRNSLEFSNIFRKDYCVRKCKKMNIENLILVALKTMRSKVHSTHALTLHACTVVELRFVTERKTNFILSDLFPSESQSNNTAMCMLELSRYNYY